MVRLVVTRLLTLPLLVVALSIAVFALVQLSPGSAAETLAGQTVTEESANAIRHRLGLDRPLYTQYVNWAENAVRGDFGRSLIDGTPVSAIIAERLPVTLWVTIGATLVGILVGLPLGILGGLRPRGWLDRGIVAATSVAAAIPAFWLGLMLVLVFALHWPILPATGYVAPTTNVGDWLESLILPSIALGMAAAAAVARQMRNSLADVLGGGFVRTALASGLPMHTVVLRHALRNALAPVVTILGFYVSVMVGISLIVESVFALPGLGQAMTAAISSHDMPVVLAITMVLVVVVVIVNLLVDICIAALNPRARPA